MKIHARNELYLTSNFTIAKKALPNRYLITEFKINLCLINHFG